MGSNTSKDKDGKDIITPNSTPIIRNTWFWVSLVMMILLLAFIIYHFYSKSGGKRKVNLNND